MHEGNRRSQSESSVSRRRVLEIGGIAATTTIAGCFGQSSEPETVPDPATIESRQQCEVCGMIIPDHPGPNGEIFYRDHSPSGHDNPARFDALQACMFPYYFEHEKLDWEATALYVTDYSAVDYTIDEQEGQPYISSYTAAETFVDAEDAVYVVGSDVHGAMGPDFLPFSSEADATAFADEYGGDVVAFDDVTPALLAR